MRKEIKNIQSEVFITEDGKEFKREQDAINYEEGIKKRLYKQKVLNMSGEELLNELANVLGIEPYNYIDDLDSIFKLAEDLGIFDYEGIYLYKNHSDKWVIGELSYECMDDLVETDSIGMTICLYIILLK